MNSQFVMGDNKFYIFHLVCQCAKLGLLLKLFLAPYCQLSSNASSTKAKPIGCCLMHLYLHIMHYHEECSNHNSSCESTFDLMWLWLKIIWAQIKDDNTSLQCLCPFISIFKILHSCQSPQHVGYRAWPMVQKHEGMLYTIM